MTKHITAAVAAAILRLAALLGIGAALTLPAMADHAHADLPAAFGDWFSAEPTVACIERNRTVRRCEVPDAGHVGVHRNPTDDAALVFIAYLPDPTADGNAVELAAAAFRRDAGGGWRFVRALPHHLGEPAGDVAFEGDGATYPVAVPKPGDPRCCPSGMTWVTVDLP